ncbi:ribosomal protein [Paenibacillus swuensis]|uniref:Ribosomal processing cysteine protease Prp n=1 Tax=Paenibacillus swuensis TaxID=1178515 RepID=A0A172TK34_9BACL|nr:ribosomal-processing cysteine protease Prp [Paenibacillus swuensis]ANE47177.1 ribosomal protein [Paenibacillus swuensis]
MIQVLIRRRHDDRLITGYTVSGHAFFANPGNDIVCAGVSAVAVGTVNAIETLTGTSLGTEMNEGLLRVIIPELENRERDQVQLLLESMVVMLKTIEESYGKHIKIKQD